MITFDDGLGSSGRTLLAEDVTIANNLLRSSGPTIFEGNEGSNWTWEGNIAFGGSLGPKSGDAGITVTDPELQLDNEELWRPSATSPAIDGGQGSYSGLFTDDMTVQHAAEVRRIERVESLHRLDSWKHGCLFAGDEVRPPASRLERPNRFEMQRQLRLLAGQIGDSIVHRLELTLGQCERLAAEVGFARSVLGLRTSAALAQERLRGVDRALGRPHPRAAVLGQERVDGEARERRVRHGAQHVRGDPESFRNAAIDRVVVAPVRKPGQHCRQRSVVGRAVVHRQTANDGDLVLNRCERRENVAREKAIALAAGIDVLDRPAVRDVEDHQANRPVAGIRVHPRGHLRGQRRGGSSPEQAEERPPPQSSFAPVHLSSTWRAANEKR